MPPPDKLTELQDQAARHPNDPVILCDLGNALVKARRPAEGLAALQRALELAPNHPRLYSNIGLALSDLGRFDEAQHAFLQALQREPDWAPAHNNLAQLYIMMGRHEDAITCTNVALTLDPNYANARKNRALAHLALGDFTTGWREYDWCAFGKQEPAYPQPTWSGEPLTNKHLLLTAHQGLGDAIQFIRYAPLLRQSAARITLEAPIPLVEVLRTAPGIDAVIAQGDPLPNADLHVPLMALPRIFNTQLDTIPNQTPYLFPDPAHVAHWQKILQPHRSNHRLVGIAWQGNPHHQWDQFRSARLAHFEPFAKLPNIQLVSLQRGPGVEQIPAFQSATNNALLVTTDGDQSTPAHLADSAALMSLLDLVITVDTAPAHLAAALARPTWVAVSVACDWRWLTARTDSPWYPNMRLFRQTQINHWPHVFTEIAHHLANLR